ncbi:MAG: hypothetical protein CVU43_14030 [Chloroflexi bacterium HGW-Chloroflexi-5]|jgi:hypothetical protein|nr:MAG: hypothetical protein CVU43_14030 [Chloroflexi bacterium HGW-Chloroflexi-5]
MKLFIRICVLVIFFSISACAPKIITIEEKKDIQSKVIDLNNQIATLSKINNQIVIALSVTPKATSTPKIPPTATTTPTPVYTPTITETPTITPTETPTLDPLKIPRGNGMFLVNVDIAPGVWRSDGKNDDCYWKVSTSTGDIIKNFFGMAGGTIYIPESAFEVELQDCGTWTFLQNP